MSVRTIVEFNHDYAHRIDEDGAEFVAWLRYALNSGSSVNWERLEQFGVRRIVQAHHSDDRSAMVNGTEYPAP